MSLRMRDVNRPDVKNNVEVEAPKPMMTRARKRSAAAAIQVSKNDDIPTKRPVKGSVANTVLSCSNHSADNSQCSNSLGPRLVWDIDPAPGVDVDDATKTDPYAYSEYVNDVMVYLKSKEAHYQPRSYINSKWSRKNRAVAVDWLVEIQEMFKFNHETLYLAVNIMDRYFSEVEFNGNDKIQLVAICSIFIASKFEERVPPFLEDICYLCRDIFSVDEIKQMEMEILKKTKFELSVPLSYSFLRRYARSINGGMHLLTTARYALELSLHFLEFCRVSPSRMAATCLLWALRVTGKGEWNNVLEKYSGYRADELEELMSCINHMVVCFSANFPDLITVRTKYRNEVFLEVALQAPLYDALDANQSIEPPESLTQLASFPGF